MDVDLKGVRAGKYNIMERVEDQEGIAIIKGLKYNVTGDLGDELNGTD